MCTFHANIAVEQKDKGDRCKSDTTQNNPN